MTSLLRASLATLLGSVSLLIATTAFAEGEACYNDIDCPGTACGDAVCNWSKVAIAPMGSKYFYCNPAGTQPEGEDGWCTTTDDCKCKGEGATCVGTFCTFTKSRGGSMGGSSAGGGMTGTMGGVAGTSGGVAGTTGGVAAATGGTVATTGGTATSPPPVDGGGCSLGVPGRANAGAALGFGLLAVGVAFARRRRR